MSEVPLSQMAPKALVWMGDQRELFRKNADRRQQSVFDIQKVCVRKRERVRV